MEQFLFICGCVVFVALILFFVFMCIEELRYILAKKHYDRISLLSDIRQCEDKLFYLNNDYVKTKNDLYKSLHKQNELLTHLIKVISKQNKD